MQSADGALEALEDLGSDNVVAQQYLARPFLIDGYKFDLRIYVLVLSCEPLSMFMFKEGLVRFCTEEYEPPREDNLDVAFMHLTNCAPRQRRGGCARPSPVALNFVFYCSPVSRRQCRLPLSPLIADAVNKRNARFKFNSSGAADADEGSKWSLEALRAWMASHGHDFDALWRRIGDIAVRTVASIQPALAHTYRSLVSPDNDGFSCFEILGLDVMLDRKLRPWLIEVNHSPSFTVDTPLDAEIKEALIADTLTLVRLDGRIIRKAQKAERELAKARLYTGQFRAKAADGVDRSPAGESAAIRASAVAVRALQPGRSFALDCVL